MVTKERFAQGMTVQQYLTEAGKADVLDDEAQCQISMWKSTARRLVRNQRYNAALLDKGDGTFSLVKEMVPAMWISKQPLENGEYLIVSYTEMLKLRTKGAFVPLAHSHAECEMAYRRDKWRQDLRSANPGRRNGNR